MRIASAAAVLAMLALGTPVAHAQSANEDPSSAEASAGAEASVSATASPDAPATGAETSADEEEEPEPMNGFGIGVKVGGGVLLRQKVANISALEGTVVERRKNEVGLALGFPLYFGDGEGFASTLEVFHWRDKDDFGARINYTGVQFAMGGSFKLATATYMFIGLGPRIGVIHGDYSLGPHGGVRVPLQLTVYPAKMLGLTFELAGGYVGTGRANVDERTGVIGSSLEGVGGFLLDFTGGIRFP